MTCRCHPILASTATHQVKYFDKPQWNSVIIFRYIKEQDFSTVWFMQNASLMHFVLSDFSEFKKFVILSVSVLEHLRYL